MKATYLVRVTIELRDGAPRPTNGNVEETIETALSANADHEHVTAKSEHVDE